MDKVANSKTATALFVRGFMAPLRAFKLLYHNPGLKIYALSPLLINLGIFVLLFGFCFFSILPNIDASSFAPAWTGAIGKEVLRASKWLFSLVLALGLFYFGFNLLGMVVASPLNDLLSEKIEQVICISDPEPPPELIFRLKALLYSIFESLKIAFKQGALMLLTLPLSLIPFAGLIPLLCVCAYYTGLGLSDVALARHFLTNKHRQAGFKNKGWEIFGLGFALELLLPIPVLGLLALPLGITAATIIYTEIDWEKALREANLDLPPGFIPPRKKIND